MTKKDGWPPTISAKEFQRIRESLRLTRDQFALELGLQGTQQTNYKMIQRIETGERHCALPMAKLAWLLGQVGTQDWPLELVSTPALTDEEAAR